MNNIIQLLENFNDPQLNQIVELGLKFHPLKNDIYSHNVVEEALIDLVNTNDELLNKAYSYNANNAELFVLRILYGYCCSVIQDPFFNTNKSNEFTSELHKLLDSLLQKAPIFNGKILYRHEKYYSIEHIKGLLEKGLSLKTQHYLTTDYENYGREDGFSFIIHTLPNDKTKAHELYKIMSHNENVPYPEHQINFERNTLFRISSIQELNNQTIVTLRELEVNNL